MPNIPISKIEKFVSTAELAPIAITHVWLDVEGARLLATDGHRAIRATVTINEGETSGPVPVEAFELARKELKAAKKRMGGDSEPDPWVKFNCFADEIFIENLLTNTKHLVVRPKLPEDAKFPNVDKVMPKIKGAPSISLNRHYLADCAVNMDGSMDALSLWIGKADEPVTIAAESGQSVLVLMPMGKFEINGEEVSARGKPAKAKAEKVS